MYRHYCEDCHHTWKSGNEIEPCPECNGHFVESAEIKSSFDDGTYEDPNSNLIET